MSTKTVKTIIKNYKCLLFYTKTLLLCIITNISEYEQEDANHIPEVSGSVGANGREHQVGAKET